MPDRVLPVVRVRAVRGRMVDPFRGTPGDDADRLASRTVDAQPVDDLVATLERLPNTRLVRAGRRFTIGRGHDVIKVSFASAARRVSLDDATFEGDGNLVITVLHALLPLFGAVEVRIGDGYRDLIDGHEPLVAIVERFDAWWIDESLKLAKQMSATKPAAAHVRPPGPPRLTSRQRIAFACAVIALAVGLLVGTLMANRKAETGESCESHEACKSNTCLRGAQPPSGVCTKHCSLDSDCPSDMQCGEVIGTRSSSCIPRAWF